MEFPDDEDIQFYATDWQKFKFLWHFRPLCLQLEGSDCSEVKLGIRVYALLDFGDNGRRYFDAMVEGVMTFNGVVIKGGVSMMVVLGWENGGDWEGVERGQGRRFD